MAQLGRGEFERLQRGGAPARLRVGEVRPGLLAAIVLLAVLAVALGIVLASGWGASAQTVVRSQGEAASESQAVEQAETVEALKEQPVATIRVHVAGSVAAPGVYELPEGARVCDAVEAAGGCTAEADPDALNLAATLADGVQVRVPALGEQLATAVGDVGSSGGASGLVNINTASAAELEALSGVGPVTAQAIVDERAANGLFASVDDLTRVSGIGEKKLATLAGQVCV